MQHLCYLNNKFIPKSNAYVGVFDRGFNFADGVYEVVAILDKKIFNLSKHLERLARSLSEIKIPFNIDKNKIETIINRLISNNKIKDGAVYLQITRGDNGKRKHEFNQMNPTIFIDVTHVQLSKDLQPSKAITSIDNRWQRCDIKTISLLPNILAKTNAQNNDAKETIFISTENIAREGSATNLFIIDNNNIIKTHPKTNNILPGITRDSIINLCTENNISIEEVFFTKNDLYEAKEVFITGTISRITPITQIDNVLINEGKIGNLTEKLNNLYNDYRLLYLSK